jgi:hypothetical protein
LGNGLGEHPKAGIQEPFQPGHLVLEVKKPFGAGGEN